LEKFQADPPGRMMSFIANDEQECHKIPGDQKQPKFLQGHSMVDDLRQATISRNYRCEEDDQAINPIHIGISFSQLLHCVGQIDPQVSIFRQFSGRFIRLQNKLQFLDKSSTGCPESRAVNVPETCEAIQHCDYVIVSKGVG
jgi:hypothetical protein